MLHFLMISLFPYLSPFPDLSRYVNETDNASTVLSPTQYRFSKKGWSGKPTPKIQTCSKRGGVGMEMLKGLTLPNPISFIGCKYQLSLYLLKVLGEACITYFSIYYSNSSRERFMPKKVCVYRKDSFLLLEIHCEIYIIYMSSNMSCVMHTDIKFSENSQ